MNDDNKLFDLLSGYYTLKWLPPPFNVTARNELDSQVKAWETHMAGKDANSHIASYHKAELFGSLQNASAAWLDGRYKMIKAYQGAANCLCPHPCLTDQKALSYSAMHV